MNLDFTQLSRQELFSLSYSSLCGFNDLNPSTAKKHGLSKDDLIEFLLTPNT